MSRTILVTGGAGFIGSNAVEMLCDGGFNVRVIDDLSWGYRDFVDKRADFLEGSISEADKLIYLLKGVDAVIHFAASSIIKFSIDNPVEYVKNNIENGVNLLEAMRKSGVNKIIFSSSAAVYGESNVRRIKEGSIKNPLNPYGATKLSFENILASYFNCYGLQSVSLRYFNAYGPRDEQKPATRAVPIWIKALLNNDPIPLYWHGRQVRDYVFVKDIARAHIDALNLSGCHIFNIGSGDGVMMQDLLKEVSDIMEVEPKIVDMGERLGDPNRLVADISRANRILKWKPRCNLYDGLVQTINYYKSVMNK